MKNKISIGLNIVFSTILIVGLIWLITGNDVNKSSIKNNKFDLYIDYNNDEKQETLYIARKPLTKNSPFNWEGFLTALSGIAGLGLKIYYNQKNKKVEDLPEYDNINHPVFSIINELIVGNVRNLELSSQGKTEVFKVLLTDLLYAYEEILHKFSKEKFNTSAEFREGARKLVLTAEETAEKKWELHKIPNILVSKYIEVYNDRIKLLLADIDTISFYRLSDTSKNYDEVAFYFFTHVASMLQLAVSIDTLKTLRTMNGQLKTLSYNGKNL